MTLQERFEAKFIKSDGCWEWTASSMTTGYGQFGVGNKKIGAHRMSYLLYVNEIPAGMCVCHKCDNKNCVRPDHLFLGTKSENTHDCMEKGRFANGISGRNGLAKLTTEQVREIRGMSESGVLQHVIADKFGVDQGNISHIVNLHTWKGIV